MSSVTKEMLENWESQHKRIAHVKGKPEPQKQPDGTLKDVTPWEVVIRKPSRAEYKRFRSMSHNANQVADAQEILARATCIYPDREKFDALLEDYPAIPEACGKWFAELSGMSAEEDLKQ